MLISLNRIVLKSFINFFAFYIICGNLLRFINLGFEHNLLISEFILYFASIVVIFVFPFNLVGLLSVFAVITCSSLFGFFYNGLHLQSCMYGIRLFGMILSGYVAGSLMHLEFRNVYSRFFRFFESMYIKNVILGFLIFIIFPDSNKLWMVLSIIGIDFKGDPHAGRFVSTYLDPNYFSAICCIPFMISHLFHKHFPNENGKWKLYLFLVTTILTWSRSGITTMIGVVIFISLYQLQKLSVSRKIGMSGRGFFYFFCLFVLFFVVLMIFSESFLFFWKRMIHMGSDPSALGRFYSFQRGFDLLSEHSVLGVGYNYLSLYFCDPNSKNIPIDSSLMILMLTFGLPFALVFICAGCAFAISMYFRFKNSNDTVLFQCSKLMFFYLFVCVFFASNFNNLLFYPFWLTPMVAIFSYLMCCLRELEKTKRQLISSSVC